MGIVDDIFDLIGTAFGILAFIDIVLFLVLFFSYWGGIIRGDTAVISVIIIAVLNLLIGAIISDIIQGIVEGIAQIFVAIAEAIASFIEALLGLFGR